MDDKKDLTECEKYVDENKELLSTILNTTSTIATTLLLISKERWEVSAFLLHCIKFTMLNLEKELYFGKDGEEKHEKE